MTLEEAFAEGVSHGFAQGATSMANMAEWAAEQRPDVTVPQLVNLLRIVAQSYRETETE